jgi:predicted TPR repeat methyltransferase
MSNRKEIHDRVLNAADADALADAYAEWAPRYDADLVQEMGYRAYVTASDLLAVYERNLEARILDAGCGTGLVGAYLANLPTGGYTHIDGLDYSPDMLAQAHAKGVYANLRQGDLTAALEIPSDHYDAVISVGTFTLGHVGPAALDELVRVTRPGGYICFTVRSEAWQQHEYQSEIDRLAGRGCWQVIETREAAYIEQEGSSCRICLCLVGDH